MRAAAAIALALGGAALALPLLDLGGGTAPAIEGGEAPEPAAVPATATPALPARLDAAHRRLAALEPESEPAGFARALRELEAAVAALGAGAAEADAEARAAKHALRSDDAELKRLLASLVSVSLAGGDAPPPLHPGGPVAGAQAAALLPASDAALRAGATAAGARLAAATAAERRSTETRAALAAGLETAEAARTTLRKTVLARAGALPPGPPDPGEPAMALARESDTLSELAGRLAGPVPPGVAEAAELAVAAAADLVATDARVTRSSRNLPGAAPALLLDMPVTGRILRGFGTPDAAGVERPGLTLAAAPRALVTAPAAGEVRYVGPFLDWNRVVAIAPADGTIVLLAGLAEVAVRPGEIVEPGAPVGFLGGRAIDAQEFLMLPDTGNDPLGAETLYMELWRAGEPVDPGPWLGTPADTQNG